MSIFVIALKENRPLVWWTQDTLGWCLNIVMAFNVAWSIFLARESQLWNFGNWKIETTVSYNTLQYTQAVLSVTAISCQSFVNTLKGYTEIISLKTFSINIFQKYATQRLGYFKWAKSEALLIKIGNVVFFERSISSVSYLIKFYSKNEKNVWCEWFIYII